MVAYLHIVRQDTVMQDALCTWCEGWLNSSPLTLGTVHLPKVDEALVQEQPEERELAVDRAMKERRCSAGVQHAHISSAGQATV